ncbi:MAG: right-handed parallel beta-helix repeat-containing protein [Kiritimatiellae bacterium]|nr:right-handed parallel beta-helix repeat-containing protein [Kiritimatiellia bacterium]
MPIRSIQAAILAACLGSAAIPASGATYHVAPGGNDSNPGTQAQPWRTIQKAADTVQPGDTVLIRGGTYSEKVRVTHGGSGPDTRVTFRAFGEEQPVLDGTGVSVGQWGALLTIDGADYVTIVGLEVADSGYYGVAVVNNALRIRLESLDVHHSASSGLLVSGITQPAYTYVRDGRYHHNQQCGIHLAHATGGYFVVENNDVYENLCSGNYDAIQTGIGDPGAGVHHGVIRNNAVYNNRPIGDGGGDAIDMGGRNDDMTHLLMEGNRLWGSNGALKFSHTASYAIMRRNVVNGSAIIDLYGPPYTRCSIYHNTLYRTWHGVQFSAYSPTPADIDWGGLQIRNNIFGFGGSHIYNVLTAGLNRGTNSMFLDSNLLRRGDGSPGEWHLQEWYELGHEPNRVVSDASAGAVFSDPGAGDLRPVAASPAIDAAQPLTRTRSAGSGTRVPVYAGFYFQDGYDGLIEPDSVQIGTNPRVRLAAADYETDVLILQTPISWRAGDPVSLPWQGLAPDIGAFEYDPDDLPTSRAVSVSRRIADGMDDVEERADGSLYVNSTDLELSEDRGSVQTIGLRFPNVQLPQGASIQTAYIQFQVDEAGSEATTLLIEGQAADNAASFGAGAYAVSGRARTAASIAWTPEPWPTPGAAAAAQRTANLAPVLQEIVARKGWQPGNAIAIIITGSGRRAAESYEGDASGAPRLCASYAQPDSDADGIPDAWESRYAPDARAMDPAADPDGDGHANWEEYLAGTDPTNRLSVLRLDEPAAGGGGFSFQFPTVDGRRYFVEYVDQPHRTNWTAFADTDGHGADQTVVDTDAPGTTHRYYRVRVQ